jgi:GNAT superfamily N-acetyltransferase
VNDADLLLRWMHELRSPAPDPVIIASLEAAATVPLADAYQAFTAANRVFNPDLHPRGKDGKFIEKLGIVKLIGASVKGKDGKKLSLDGRRARVEAITPDPQRPGDPRIRVAVLEEGKPIGSIELRRNQMVQAPEKARLDLPMGPKPTKTWSDDRDIEPGNPTTKNGLANLTDDEVIDKFLADPDDQVYLDEYNRRFGTGPQAPAAKPPGRVGEVATAVEKMHPGVTVELSEPAPGIWRLSAIKVAPSARGQGLAGKALDTLLEEADGDQVMVSLTPEQFGGEGGMTDTQLRAWYARKGFVPNTGAGRVQETSDSMVRPPETPEARAARQERRKAQGAVRQMPDEALDTISADPATSETWMQAVKAEQASRAAKRAEDAKRRGQIIAGINEQAAKLSTTDPDLRAQQVDKILGKLRFSPIDTNKTEDDVYPPGQSGRWSAARHAQHEAIWADMLTSLEAADIPKDRDVLVVGGLPGAGKSTTLKPGGAAEKFGVVAWEPTEPVPPGATHVVVNPDIFKDMLIQRGMLPQGISSDLKPREQVTFIHEESNYVGKMITNRLAAAGYNVVLDNTMQSASDMERRSTPLAQQGYRFRGLFVDIPVDESADSVEARYKAEALTPMGGRFVPSSITRSGNRKSSKSYSKNRDAMDELIAKDWFTEWMIVDNTGVSKGAPLSEIVGEGSGDGSAADRYVRGAAPAPALPAPAGNGQDAPAGPAPTLPF